jgi:hypothetical protein
MAAGAATAADRTAVEVTPAATTVADRISVADRAAVCASRFRTAPRAPAGGMQCRTPHDSMARRGRVLCTNIGSRTYPDRACNDGRRSRIAARVALSRCVRQPDPASSGARCAVIWHVNCRRARPVQFRSAVCRCTHALMPAG